MATFNIIENTSNHQPHLEVTLTDDETLQLTVDDGDRPGGNKRLTIATSLSAREPRRSIVTKGCLNVRKNSILRGGIRFNENDHSRARRGSRREVSSANVAPGNRDNSPDIATVKVAKPALGKLRRSTMPAGTDTLDKTKVSDEYRNPRRISVAGRTPARKADAGPQSGLGLTGQQVKAFKEVFDLFDRNGGGTIDADDLEDSLKSVGIVLTKDEIYDVIQSLDMDQSGDIDFKEFLNLMTSTERFIEVLTKSDEETNKQNYHYLLFEALTVFMKECALKNMHTILGYYQTKYHSSKMTHVVNHYAAGTRLIGLTEKQLKQHLEHLKKETSHGGTKNLSPYAQPLHIVMSTTNLPVHNTRRTAQSSKKTGRIRLRVRRQNGESNDINAERSSTLRKSGLQACDDDGTHEVGWVSQRTEHIEVKLPPYYLKSLVPFDELTAEDLPRIRAQVNNATRDYRLQRRHTQVHDGIEHWHSLEPELISPKSLRKNFRVVFSTYNDIDMRYLPLSG